MPRAVPTSGACSSPSCSSAMAYEDGESWSGDVDDRHDDDGGFERARDAPDIASSRARRARAHRFAARVGERPDIHARRARRLALRSFRALERRRLSLTVLIPAHNEAGSIAGDGRGGRRTHSEAPASTTRSSSSTTRARMAPPRSSRSLAGENRRIRYHRSHNPRGFGFAVRAGLDLFEGDAVAIVMADGSDDPGDLVRYVRVLEEGYDCAFGSRFVRGSRRPRLPEAEARAEPHRERRDSHLVSERLQRHDERIQGVPTERDRNGSAAPVEPLQPHSRAPAQSHRARAQLQGDSDLVAQSQGRRVEAVAAGDGQPLRVHRPVRPPRAASEPRATTDGPEQTLAGDEAARAHESAPYADDAEQSGRRRVCGRRPALRTRLHAALHGREGVRPGRGRSERLRVARARRSRARIATFSTFYGPGNPWFVAGAFSVLGERVGSERVVGWRIACSSSLRSSSSEHGWEGRWGPYRAGVIAATLLGGDIVWAYATYGALAFGLLGLAILSETATLSPSRRVDVCPPCRRRLQAALRS